MIARDTGGGTSFAGAGRYYLHDRNAHTDERVAFTYTDNLLTNDAEKALKVMAWTALHQADLKRSAGVKATGRKLEAPVHTFAFSWAKNETPDRDHMINVAREAMAVLGLSEHEALYVGHDDTEHRHIHVIVNRVHPDHGKAATLSKSRLALSKWAESYEQEHGIHCHRRIENNARRLNGERVIDRESRRRNADQFADWRDKRRAEATSSHEQRRFHDWAERRRNDYEVGKQERFAQLERLQAAQRLVVEERLQRTYDTSAHKEKLAAVEASLAARGVKGLWHRLTGRRNRDLEQKDALEKNITSARTRHQEALQGLQGRFQGELDQLASRERARAQELALRIENAQATRERDGWTSIKTDRPREVAPAREQDNLSSPQKSWRDQPREHSRER